LPPELQGWALEDLNKEEIEADLLEAKEKGGLELQEFLPELERVVHKSGRTEP
jgi:hypothetical protein